MTATPPTGRAADDFRYMPNHYATAYDGTEIHFDADCPTGCGRVIGWVDSKTDGPRPGACDCDIERNAA